MNPILKFDIRHLDAGAICDIETDCLLLPVPGKVAEDPLLGRMDPSGRLQQRLSERKGESLQVPLPPEGLRAEQLLLVHPAGKGKSELSKKSWLKAMEAMIRALAASKAKKAAVVLQDPKIKNTDLSWAVEQTARLAEAGCYRYSETIGKKDRGDLDCPLQSLTLLVEDGISLDVAKAAAKRGGAVGLGINTARSLGDLPPNICNPTYLARKAKELAAEHDCLELELLEEKDLKKQGMRSLLSVAEGSRQPAFLFRLRYRNGGKKSNTCALVGKGVTFDTGGISLKPSANMADMKYDMSGAGAVIAVMRALAELRPAINVDGIVAAVENMPGGQATRPGDVVTSMSGKTIEILNTDAEGRLILCDALSWAARSKPDLMIDIATLTGACVVALGYEAAGMYSNDDSLAEQLHDAGQVSGDRVWRMPLWEEYDSLLKTRYADVANISSGPGAGSITAACFLHRFVEDIPWAHLDVAGTAHRPAGQRSSTGRPVGLLMQFLLDNL